MTIHKWWLLGLCLIVIPACHKRPAPNKAELVAQGDTAMEKKNYRAAVAAYTSATADRKSPPDVPVLMKLANASLLDGRLDPAVRAARRAAAAMPDDATAQLLLARVWLAQRRYDDVWQNMRAFNEKHPNNLGVLIAMANAKAHLEDSAVAFSQLLRAKNQQQFEGLAFNFRGGPRKPNPPSSADDKEAEEIFRTAMTVDPASPRPQLAYANFLWATKRAQDAEPILKKVADEHPDQSIATYSLGMYYVLLHRDDEAEHYLKLAATGVTASLLGDLQDDAAYALSDLYRRTHRPEESYALLVSMLPKYPEAAVPLARAEFESGRREEANKRLDQVLSAQPPLARAQLLKAQFLLEMGQPDKALPFARASANAFPSSEEAKATLARALFAVGDLENAFDQYKDAAALNPGSGDHLLELARTALALDRGNEALVFAKDAVRLKPKNIEVALAEIRARVMTGDLLQAEQTLSFLLSTQPQSADLLVEMGTIQAARGAEDAARTSFTKALQAKPDSVGAVQGLTSIDLKHGLTDAARKRAEAALLAHPTDPAYLQVAAQVYAADHDTQRLESTLKQLVTVDPANLQAVMDLSGMLADPHPDAARQVLQTLVARRPRAVTARYALAKLLERERKVEDAKREYDAILAEHGRPEIEALRLLAASGRNALPTTSGQ